MVGSNAIAGRLNRQIPGQTDGRPLEPQAGRTRLRAPPSIVQRRRTSGHRGGDPGTGIRVGVSIGHFRQPGRIGGIRGSPGRKWCAIRDRRHQSGKTHRDGTPSAAGSSRKRGAHRGHWTAWPRSRGIFTVRQPNYPVPPRSGPIRRVRCVNPSNPNPNKPKCHGFQRGVSMTSNV